MSVYRPGLSLAQCRSLHVVARFARRSLVELDSYWPVPLDGLLAVVAHRRRPSSRTTEAPDLPLARFIYNTHTQWSWLASVAAPLGVTSPEWAQRWKQEPGPLAVDCAGAEWYATGDRDQVADLLRDVAQVGNRGHWAPVQRWDVVDIGRRPRNGSVGVWLPSGVIARPIAARAAGGLGVPDADTVDSAVRPPYQQASPTDDGTAFGRRRLPVIAPWTRRPTP